MRKLLLASVATLGTGGLMGAAFAQAPASAPAGAPSQGQQAWPAAGPVAYVNDNNNYQAPALPGAVANPTPGTIVIHINGKVQTEQEVNWTNQDTRFATAPAAGSFAAGQGVNGTGPVKLEPIGFQQFMRLYFGADAMATNGLRYGAAIELRQNFSGQSSSNTSSGASGYSSASETVFVRRAFTYLAGEDWGIVRLGQADGIIGIFDNGVTTSQWGIIGEFNGGDGQNMAGNAVPPFFFLSQAGNEYVPTKAVYLSPQIAGFDFGIQYAPNTSNGYAGFGNVGYAGGITGTGIGTGLSCGAANTGCATLSSGPGIQDGSRALDWTGVGLRYQAAFSGFGVLAYAAYEFSGHADYTGVQYGTPGVTLASAASTLGTSALPNASTGFFGGFNGKYQGLNFGNGGIALTYAGFTLAGNIIGGRINGQLGLVPQNGASEVAYTIGLKYVNGPWTFGVAGEEGWFQGNPVLAGISQRRGRGIVVGAQYAVAPGLTVAAEYQWSDQQQGNTNFLAGTVSSGPAGTVGNNAHGQAFVLGQVVNF